MHAARGGGKCAVRGERVAGIYFIAHPQTMRPVLPQNNISAPGLPNTGATAHVVPHAEATAHVVPHAEATAHVVPNAEATAHTVVVALLSAFAVFIAVCCLCACVGAHFSARGAIHAQREPNAAQVSHKNMD